MTDQPVAIGDHVPHTFTWRRTYDVPAAALFAAVANTDLYAEVAPNLSRIEILSGEGAGMVRQCTDPDGASWTETYTEWVDGERFATRVDIETYPASLQAMIAALDASWSVTPESDASSTVTIEIRAELTALGVEVLRDGGQADALFQPVLDGWGAHLSEARPVG